jgi:hypothetical protein
MIAMRRRTPQEKKKLSYERDRRNVYGEAPHAARKSIPLRKALRNRANRHYQNQQLGYVGPAPDEALADELGSLIHRRVPQRWRKDRDAPLGEVVADKLKERAVLGEDGGRTLRVFRWDRDTGELIPVAVPPNNGLHPTRITNHP